MLLSILEFSAIRFMLFSVYSIRKLIFLAELTSYIHLLSVTQLLPPAERVERCGFLWFEPTYVDFSMTLSLHFSLFPFKSVLNLTLCEFSQRSNSCSSRQGP